MTTAAFAVAGDDADLPRNFEAEQAVLGSLLLDRDAIIEVNGILRPDDFAFDAHSTLYRLMLDLYEQRQPVDLVTVVEEARRRDLLDRIGKRGYPVTLANITPTAVHVEHYARIVERLAVLRRLISAGSQIMGIARAEAIEADDAIGQAEEALRAVTQRRTTLGFEAMPDILARILERLDFVHENRGAIVGVPTGFIDLDKILGGLQRSDLVILGARPAHGKTALALGMCHNAAIRYKQRIAIFSLEMSKEQLVQRLLCMQGRLDSGRLRSGYIDEDEWTRLIEAAAVLSESKIFIDDSAGTNPAEMRNRARRLQAEQGLDLIVVDYLQLMSGRSSENRVQEISGISRALKILARELNVPVLALSQVSRGVDSRTSHVPLLSDLRESGCLAGDSPVYLPDEGIYRPIADLVGKRGFRVLAVNTETRQLEPATVSAAFSTGIKPVYRLKTCLGRTIRATWNHRFLTPSGWQRLDQLVPGSLIAVPPSAFDAEPYVPSPVAASRPLRTPAFVASGASVSGGTHSVSMLESGLNPWDGSHPTAVGVVPAIRPQSPTALGDAASADETRQTISSPLPVASVSPCLRGERTPVSYKPEALSIHWDQIATIEPAGEIPVYDLTVERLHNFVAADIIVHNSIEQDADVVVFLCREEMYDPETEKRHIADLYIAKHRNGPTGHLALYFDQQQTRFRDLETHQAGPL